MVASKLENIDKASFVGMYHNIYVLNQFSFQVLWFRFRGGCCLGLACNPAMLWVEASCCLHCSDTYICVLEYICFA